MRKHYYSLLCDIIVGSYSMIEEGFDCKELNPLIMATPKNSIEQAVGRIMRVKHSNPLIIDIIDQHTLFKNQWVKRRAFYQKNNYKIMSTEDYRGNNWNELTKKSKNNKCNVSDDNIDTISMGKCLIKL